MSWSPVICGGCREQPRQNPTRSRSRAVAAPDNGRPRAAIELRFVAVAISWHLNRDTGDAWPGFATLAKETGLRQRTVIRAVKWLESKGHLHVTHSRGGNVPNRSTDPCQQ
jgi:hypothetical protein